jgi:DNA-binding CsgD family transcriptional regulator
MVADGRTAGDIAKSLYISPHTIKRHMANIREKLGVRTQAAAVAALQRTR